MNFVYCEICSNGILISNTFMSAIIQTLFAIVFSVVLARYIVKKIKKKKKMDNSVVYIIIVTIILFFISFSFLVPIYNLIARNISDNYFIVDPKYKIMWGETIPSYDELVNFNYNYVRICLFVFSMFSYAYFKIISLIRCKKFLKYIMGGFYILIIVLSILVFFNYQDYLYNKIEDSYTCRNACDD